MKLKSIFKKTPVTKPEVKETASQIKPEVPEGLLKRCNKCGKGIFTEDYKKNLEDKTKGGYVTELEKALDEFNQAIELNLAN